MRKKTITNLTRIVLYLRCCHFNISRYLTVKEQVKRILWMIAMTAKFISSELSCKGYSDIAFKNIQSLHRNSNLGLCIVLTMVLFPIWI